MKLSSFLQPLHILEETLTNLSTRIISVKQNYPVFYREDVFYNGAIITLYGAFENFVDKTAQCYLDFVYGGTGKTAEAASLKEELDNVYQFNLGEFLSYPKRHTNIDSSTLSINHILSSFLEARTNGDYSLLNKDILLFHGGNMKSDALFTFFRTLKFPELHSKICSNDCFKQFLCGELGIEESNLSFMISQKNADLYSQLNRLVDERNVVAHYGLSINKISLDELVSKTIQYIIVLCDSITRAMIEYFANNYDFDAEIEFSDSTINHLFNHTIVCHSNENKDIHKGDYFVFKDKKEHFFVSKIVSIQLNNVDLENTSTISNVFGFKVDGRICNSDLLAYSIK